MHVCFFIFLASFLPALRRIVSVACETAMQETRSEAGDILMINQHHDDN